MPFALIDRSIVPTCASCGKTNLLTTERLPRCSRCHTTPYCNTDCQKADWKKHKKLCRPQTNATPPQPDPSVKSPREFLEARLGFNAHDILCSKPMGAMEFVFTTLIDSYRMRVEDEYNFRGQVAKDSLYAKGDPKKGFRRYLIKAESRAGLLPPWWTKYVRGECIAHGARDDIWNSLHAYVDKASVQEHYDDSSAPMQLRMIADAVVGSYVASPGVGLSDI